METLTERQQVILSYVIDAHIESAQPVGSHYLTERYRVHYSPATVRHEMGALEEMGFLTHPHTSSGRIPTDGGYRYYVDHCVGSETIPESEIRRVSADLKHSKEEDTEVVPEQVSRFLSAFSGEAGLVVVEATSPEREKKHVPGKLLVQGSSRILGKPEFQNVHKLRVLFDAFEEKNELMNWISCRTSEDGVSIMIGHENEPEALWDCTVVSARCPLDENNLGSIAVLGPKRMRYARVVPLVETFALLIGRAMS
ncbi:MAG: hypothetical protein PHN49_09480 [Candidatus Omnitrophica bacterium]|nr:hypothetical protein [Candidatus Omnitrophota bacterium]MDD5671859.1 hypothetical protein [Candidatus Omnitrophota bacterium]